MARKVDSRKTERRKKKFAELLDPWADKEALYCLDSARSFRINNLGSFLDQEKFDARLAKVILAERKEARTCKS